MNGLYLKFSNTGDIELTDQAVSGDACLQQNALVNLATMAGSDKAYPDKGVKLMRAATQGLAYDTQSIQHQANFAALSTLSFMRNHEYASEQATTISDLQLQLIALGVQTMKLQATFLFADGLSVALPPTTI